MLAALGLALGATLEINGPGDPTVAFHDLNTIRARITYNTTDGLSVQNGDGTYGTLKVADVVIDGKNTTLSQLIGERTNNNNNNDNVLPASLVAYWPFDSDLTSIGTPGVPLRGTVTGSVADSLVTWTCGRQGGAGLATATSHVAYGQPSQLNFAGAVQMTLMMVRTCPPIQTSVRQCLSLKAPQFESHLCSGSKA